MPIYDYKCSTCGHSFELRQSFDSKPEATCPVCHNGAVRQFHPVPIMFKGSGWYVNDYGKRSSFSSSSPSTDSSNHKTEKTEAKAEPRSEAKKETEPTKA